MATVGNLLVKIGADATALASGLAGAQRSLDRFAGKIEAVGRRMSMAITLPLAGIGAAALKSFGDIERLEKGLAAIMGSSEAARAEMEKLRKVAESPSLSFEQAVRGSLQLQSVGTSAEKARKIISELGNTAAFSGSSQEQTGEAIRQMSQMIAKGRILQEEWSVITENVGGLNTAMQNAFGHKNIERIRESGMSVEAFLDTLVGGMEQMPRVEGGLSNAFENIGISAKFALSQIGESINELFDVQGIAEGVSRALDRLADGWNGLSDNAQRWIVIAAAVAASIGPILLGVSALIKGWAMLKGALSVVLTIFGALSIKIILITALVAALAAVAVTVYANWQNLAELFANIWERMVVSAKNGVGRMLRSVDEFLNKMAEAAGISAKSNLAAGFEDQKLPEKIKTEWINPIDSAKKALKDLADYMGIFRKEAEVTAAAATEAGEAIGNVAGGGTGSGRKRVQEMDFMSFSRSPLPDSVSSMEGSGKSMEKMLKVSDKLAAKNREIVRGLFEMREAGYQASTTFGKDLQHVFFSLADIVNKDLGNSFKSLGKKIGQAADIAAAVFGALDQTFQAYVANKNAAIDANYEKERDRIENSRMNEEQKQVAIQALEEETDRKRRKLARLQAIREKALAIFQATINGAVAVINAFKTDPTGILAGIIGAISAVQIGLISSQKIPALAKGGLAFGPQLAMVGDNPGARVDPEVIAPLSKLQGMFGGGMGQEITVKGVIAGRDILLVQERALQDRQKTRGF